MPALRLRALELLPLKIRFSVVGGSDHVVIFDYASLLVELEKQLQSGNQGDFVVTLANGGTATISSRDAKRLICLLEGYDESIVTKPTSSFIGAFVRGAGSYLGVGMGKAIERGSTKVGLEGAKAANSASKPVKLAAKVHKNVKKTEKQFEIENANRQRRLEFDRRLSRARVRPFA